MKLFFIRKKTLFWIIAILILMIICLIGLPFIV
jgi:hypothetical protein